MTKSPLAADLTLRTSPVPLFVTVTSAPGITAPPESVTVPTISAVVVCADERLGITTKVVRTRSIRHTLATRPWIGPGILVCFILPPTSYGPAFFPRTFLVDHWED